ncbi:MAG TPA: hypothetical protein VK997_06805, partial [Deferrisomatales bacterium]|nr:hypothetical protein [Deferrisomatales bacterium]
LVALAAVATFLAYPKLAPANVVGVSKVKANPAGFLGKVTITGMTGNAYPDQGVVELADEKACCNLFLFVPSTEAQRTKLEASGGLYGGTYPSRGQPLEAHGVLKETAEGYAFEVSKLTSGGEVLLRKL